jgi:hypothetical protein
MGVVSCRICVDGMAANNITGLHTSVVVLRKYACRTHLRACSPSQTPRDHIYTIYTCTVAPSLRETDLSMVTRRKCSTRGLSAGSHACRRRSHHSTNRCHVQPRGTRSIPKKETIGATPDAAVKMSLGISRGLFAMQASPASRAVALQEYSNPRSCRLVQNSHGHV